jgi:hypothetical protein
MAYLNKKNLLKAFNEGKLELVSSEVRRYGTITDDLQWEEVEGHYKGANRILQVLYYRMLWTIELHNGNVKEIGWRAL